MTVSPMPIAVCKDAESTCKNAESIGKNAESTGKNAYATVDAAWFFCGELAAASCRCFGFAWGPDWLNPLR